MSQTMWSNDRMGGFFSVMVYGEQARLVARGGNVQHLMVELLAHLDASAEGAYGYIAEAKTGHIVQKHCKSAMT